MHLETLFPFHSCLQRGTCAAGGSIISPIERAASGFDDAEVERACRDDFSSVLAPSACTRVCAMGSDFMSKIVMGGGWGTRDGSRKRKYKI